MGPTHLAYGHIVWDTLFATAMIYLSYATDAKFIVLYFLNIFNAAFLLFTPGAVFAFLTSATAYTLVSVLAFQQRLPLIFGLSLQMRGWSERDVWFSVLGKGFLFFVTAVCSAFVARTYGSRDEAIEASKSEAMFLEQKLRGLLDHIEDGLISVDAKGNIHYANPAARELLELHTKNLIGHNLFTLFSGLSPQTLFIKSQELNLMRADGKVSVCHFSSVPLKSNPKHPDVKLVWIRDLTNIRTLEIQMKRKEHLAAVGEMAARVAHEIRNPLTAISGAIEYLSLRPDQDEESQRLMALVSHETERLDHILTDFLGFSKPGQGTFQTTVSFSSLVEDALELFQKSEASRDISLETHIDSNIVFKGDPAALKQMVWNFINNSVEAMNAQGRLQLSLKLVNDGDIVLSVSDSGPGIPSDLIPRVFDPFFSTKAKGTGLGLSVVHRIVENHRGHIEVDSVLGRGTTFRVVFKAEEKRVSLYA